MDERLTNNAEDIKIRHQKRQNERRRAMKRRRMIFYCVLTIIILSVILFFTPLFNIKNVNIAGNSKVETAQIKQAIGSVEEDNLFRLNVKKIVENVKTIPYVNDVNIKKKIFPVGLNVSIDECQPVAYIMFNEQYVILDKNMKVLEVNDTGIEGICEITGTMVQGASAGSILATDDNEKLSFITDAMHIFTEQEIINKIGNVNFSDINNITFTFENRLNVICGSSVDFAKKVSMFKKAVNSAKLTENSRGTIDISISGKAIYTP